jgi:hypothetical protein
VKVGEVAALVGCNRTALYKKPLFSAFVKILRQERGNLPHGWIKSVPGGGTEVDAIDEHDPSEGLDD